jgi:hypothetical protein
MSSPSSNTRRVTFRIHYETAFGEALVVVGGCAELGDWRLEGAFPLAFQSGWWVGTVAIAAPATGAGGSDPVPLHKITYKYAVTNAAAATKWEHGPDRALLVSPTDGPVDAPACYEARDTWRVRSVRRCRARRRC